MSKVQTLELQFSKIQGYGIARIRMEKFRLKSLELLKKGLEF